MTSERRRYQHDVERLLEAIADGVAELQGLRARGVRTPGLSDREGELTRMRRQLAAVVSRSANQPSLASATHR